MLYRFQPPIQRAAAAEMRAVLEWWTGRSLKHTSTFGVRIYHRDSMLINRLPALNSSGPTSR